MLEIINQKYMKFLFLVSEKTRNISELAKRGDLTEGVASTIISRWAKSGVAIKERKKASAGRKMMVNLTEYGRVQVKLLRQLFNNHIKKCAGEFNSPGEKSEKEANNDI